MREDRPACEGFSCGERGYERQLDAFITHDVWNLPRADVRVVVAVDEDTGRIVGFAAWHPTVSVEPDLESEEREYKTRTSIQISRFALDRTVRGTTDDDGYRVSDRFYASVEDDILGDPGTEPGMEIYLACDVHNAAGLAYWERQGYENIGRAVGSLTLDEFVRYPWPE